MSSIFKSSDDISSVDYFCTSCYDKNFLKRAEFYCEGCQKCYCQKCIHPHDELYFQHIKHERDGVNSWPAAKDLPQQCILHTYKQMDLYCFDHHQPFCSRCFSLAHGNCRVATRIPESALLKQENTQAFIVQETSEHNIKIPKDEVQCFITGICALPDGQVILADWDNKTVKLLDERYQVVSNLKVATAPFDICQVASNEAALTVGKHIQFVRVNDKQLLEGRCFCLEKMNESTGIAYHQGHLFITSGTALHEYEINGTWLRQLYEDSSDSRTVWKSVVSPAGDKVYVSQPSLHRLLTLDRNGKILATFHDLGLLRPWGVCVAPEGQIIVCGDASDTVMLVDRDGKRKLATIATYSNGLRWPWSVYYTKNTDAIIVGQWYDKIVVLKIKEREKGPFIRLKCQKDKFLILKYTCETIEGILTICGQDLEAHALLDEKLHSFVSADYIQVYTTEHLLNHFETFEMEENQGMSANSVVAAIAQTSTLSLIIVKDDMCESIVNALKKSVICNSGVLIVGNMKQKDSLDIPNVFFGMTESEKILKEADYVLERCAFGIFKTVIIKLKEFAENSGIFSELKNASLQEVYTSVRACFENASIPGPECPDIPLQTFEYPENIDMAIDAVKRIPSIIGCVKKSGRLQIYIEAGAANSEVEKNVQRELDYYDVIKKDFVYRSVKPLCSSGDSAFGGIGTLGGFVVKNDNLPDASVKYLRETSSFKPMTEAAASAANTYRLVALVARHVAIASGAANLTVGNDLLEIGHFGPIGIAGGIDVLPVDVYEECEQYCDTRFKTELGVSMTTTQLPSREDILTRIGAYTPVHIWGAHSAPGLGTLTPEIFHAANGDYIKIRDRRADVLFANEGDSGAMVCYFDAHREVLYAVAVLISQVEDLQVQKREYLAHILDIALQKLSILNGNNYVFIGDRDP